MIVSRRLLLTLAILLVSVPLLAQGLTTEDCLGCHNDPTLTKDVKGKPVSVSVDGKKFQASIHSAVGCPACHSDVTAYPHEPLPKPVDCSGCHADQVKEYANSAHARARAKGDTVAATCIDCHGKHDILPKSDPLSRTNHFNVPRTCANCHESQRATRAHPLPAAATIEGYFTSVHGKGTMEKGLIVSAICSDCHGAHSILPKSDPSSTISHQNVPRTCAKCHDGIFRQFEQSTHGQLWAANNPKGPVCVTCHTAHAVSPVESAAFRLNIPTGCETCHAKEAPTYRDSFHGQATALGYAASAKCSDCHTPHLNLPKNDPRSSVAPANLLKTCRKCHPNANARFASFQPHADPHNKAKSPQMYYVYNWGMKWLMLLVFGSFGLHTLLWLQRSIVAAIRGELPKHEINFNTKWVRRFNNQSRGTHIAIVVSFLLLAATGLPLMYSHMPWGSRLAHVFGGVGVTTIIHRFFAIVTFGYALYHLWYIIQRGLIRGERNIFWGPESMMPAVRDVRDLIAMVKWFFYRGPQPKLDRYVYWEKFDYFAVFWGVPVIGLSGLMLWLPQLVTSFLPGWILNVAMLVHGDEALLAIGFIFTFHFFHNHLRPENFPLDPVMFTGKLPLDKFMEERRDEYERLVRQGRFEDVLTTPPTEGEMTFARWFGFTSYGIGIILIVAIYITVISRFVHGLI